MSIVDSTVAALYGVCIAGFVTGLVLHLRQRHSRLHR